MRKELQGLKRAIIIQRIEARAEAPIKEGKGRIRNFIDYRPRPIEIDRFKDMSLKKRAKVIIPAPVKLIDVSLLHSAQRNVIKKNLMYFFERPSLTASAINHRHYGKLYPIVARCNDGYYVYDGNHRMNYRLLAGLKAKVKLIDLRYLNG